jgi:hypothetical protein
MNYLPPFTAIGMGNRVSCPDTFLLTCVSRSDRHRRWQQTLTREVWYEDVHSFWGRVIKAMWELARHTPEAHIYLQYVYGSVDPYDAERFDVYKNCEWVFLDVIRTCDEPEVRVVAAEHLANLRANGPRYSALYAIPS